ncbi:MAG TPA: hypothetical protein VFX35_02960 [Solirubrobacterales bacterium]|nr:hypothetical protein [Solirubrobacterales bacterium]
MTEREYEGPPLKIELREALGVIADSPNEGRRLRLLDAAGDEIASLTGRLVGPAWVAAKGEQVAELSVSGGGLSARVKIPLDSKTRCTISPDGTLTGTLPGGAQWITTPLWAGTG